MTWGSRATLVSCARTACGGTWRGGSCGHWHTVPSCVDMVSLPPGGDQGQENDDPMNINIGVNIFSRFIAEQQIIVTQCV